MITTTQEAIVALIRRNGPMTINAVFECTDYSHTTVRRVLHGQRFAVVGRQGGQGPGAHVYDLAERANRAPEARPNSSIEQLLLDQAMLAQTIRMLARRGHKQVALSLGEVWLLEDGALKRMVGGAI